MSTPINITAIPALLRPGLAAIVTTGNQYPDQWTEIFTKHTSDKEREIEMEVKSLGLAQLKQEAASLAYGSMNQTYTTTYINRYVAIGFIITRQAIMDNLYKSQFPMQAESLKRSLKQTKEILGASVLNNGFDTNYPIGDGKPVFSTTHPISGGPGVVANTFSVQADLSEASLQDALIAVQKFRDAAGLLENNKPTKMIVPAELQFTADRILESQFRTGTANNDVNAVYNMNAVPMGYRVNQYLTDSNAWFLMTDAQNGFKYYEREGVAVDTYVDFDTKNVKASAIERYSFGVTNFRAAFGSSGA